MTPSSPPETAASSPSRLGSRMLAWAVSLSLAGVLLYISLRGIDWRRVGEVMTGARLSLLAVVALFYTTNLLLRALRWRILLTAEGPVTPGDAFWATAAGYFGNNFLPARAGELVRSVMIHSRSGLSKTYVLTTALSERFADAIALVLITALVLPFLPGGPEWLMRTSRSIAILAVVAVLAIAILPRFNAFGLSMIARLPLPARLHERAAHVFDHFLMGLRAFHSHRRLAGFVLFTIVIWVIDAVGYVILARSLGLTLALPVSFLLIAGLGLGSALPSTPGYVGIYQFVAVTVLVPFGISRSDAIACILMFQAVNYALITLWGTAGFWRFRKTTPARLRSAEARS